MGMNASALKTAIVNNIKAKEGFDKFDDSSMGVIIDAIAEEVISHIQNNAVVSTNVSIVSVSGVTTGPSASGPGTGTGTGTIA